MTKFLNATIDAGKILEIQRVQYQERLLIKGIIQPQTTLQLKTSIGNLGHFLSQEITGSFTTLQVKAAPALEDQGINYLRAKLIDGTGQRELFNDYIPLDIWLSPGRVRAVASQLPAPYTLATGDLGAPSNTLFYPTAWEYLFQANSEIILETKNDSDAPNFISISFSGIRIKTKAGGR